MLRLTDHCLLSIRDDFVEKGIINDLSCIHPILRQKILDMILRRGTISWRQCTTAFSTPQFLGGLTSLNLQNGKADDHDYLDDVTNSLATICSTGETIGAGLVELKLNLYDCGLVSHQNGSVFINLKSIFNMLCQCPNLESLDLRHCWASPIADASAQEAIKKSSLYGRFLGTLRLRNKVPPLRNGHVTIIKKKEAIFSKELLQPCLSVFRNLRQLSLNGSGDWTHFGIQSPMDVFKNLTSLSITKSHFWPNVWSKLENAVRGTLQHLRMEYISSCDKSEWIRLIQAPFPYLKTLHSTVGMYVTYENLKACPNLDEVHVGVTSEHQAHDLLPLTQIQAKAIIDFWLFGPLSHDFAPTMKTMNFIGDKVASIVCWGFEYTQHAVRALEHALNVCPNLEKLDLRPGGHDDEDRIPNYWNGYRTIMQTLHSLFTARERASKLQTLDLHGIFEPNVLDALFENCINLNSFVIWGCPHLKDSHLLQWAERGIQLVNLVIEYCENVSEDGVIALLESIGKNLENFGFHAGGVERLSIDRERSIESWRRLWPVLAAHCRFIKIVHCSYACPEDIRAKFFNLRIDRLNFDAVLIRINLDLRLK